jgi:hypothetical protein
VGGLDHVGHEAAHVLVFDELLQVVARDAVVGEHLP